MEERLLPLVILALLCAGTFERIAVSDDGQVPARLLRPSDLVYRGAFRLPDEPEEVGWAWSGAAMAYYPGGAPDGSADGYPGSLFDTGHDWHQYVSEVSPNDNWGWWSTVFVGEIFFYDPADLAAVATSKMKPHEPQPYAVMEIDQYFFSIKSKQQLHYVGAASFDRQRGLLYVFEPRADGDTSIVHVWKVGK